MPTVPSDPPASVFEALGAMFLSPSALAVLISTLVAIASTIVLLRAQKNLTCRQQTIGMLMNNQWDKDFIAAFRLFREITGDPERLDRVADSISRLKRMKADKTFGLLSLEEQKLWERAEVDSRAISKVLDYYELIAVGIREGIYDEMIYRRWYQQSFVRDFNICRLIIEHVRSASALPRPGRLYIEFEELARIWQLEGTIASGDRVTRHGRRRTFEKVSD